MIEREREAGAAATLRLEQGLSKTEIARRVGVGRATIHRWIVAGQLDRELECEAVRYRSRPSV